MNLILSIALFTQLAAPYDTRVFLDANANFLIYARYYDDELISIDSIKSVENYLDYGIMAHNRDLLLRELRNNIIKKGGYASSGLFGTFEIALPKGGFSDFMGETSKLDVGGHVKITLGGSETFISNLPGERNFSWFPELEMKQEMAINLDGEVGDRMKVYIDHNSERISEIQNKITVTYKGREDEIIQEIEGGDTQLSIPSTTYTGDIPSHRGLFGIKSTAKLGPLDLVAVASKEQTQRQELELEGSAQAQYDTTWAKEYERRRFFWLGTYDEVIDLDVYVEDNTTSNNQGTAIYYGAAYLDTLDDNIPDDTTNPTNFKHGFFTRKIEGFSDDYQFVPGANIIELNSGLPEDHVLGVWYKKIVGNDTVEVGIVPESLGVADTIQLKLICPERPDTSSYTWNYEKKNYYQIVSRGSSLDSLRIYRKPSGSEPEDNQNGVPFIQLLGVDKNQDGLVDENTAFRRGQGLLIFQDHDEPFASDILDDPDPDIYRDPDMPGRGKYFIYKKTIELAKSVYDLPEGVEEVRVYVDQDVLTEGVDYRVDYDEGRVELIKHILPSQKVRIEIEYAPFFSAAQKSLVGVRGSLRPFGDAMLGSSFFYRTESYPAEHIRLREEPFNRMIWEADFTCPQDLPFLTKLVDWLPLVETDAESWMKLNFEGAYSFSNLNARGEVFLDDLESSTVVSNDFSTSGVSWALCSKPTDQDTANFVQNRIIWFTPREQILNASSIYVDPIDPTETATVLKVIFRPDDTLSFGGLMQYFYSENFEDIENLELIIKGQGGRMHVDFAQDISEDQLRRNKDGEFVGMNHLDNEDNNADNTWNENSEDTGLDNVYGDDDTVDSLDDGNDDYQTDDYTGGINGTERNGRWDSEDIDRNGTLNNKNRYYGYSIHLDSVQYLESEVGLRNGWKMFRVPIKDSTVWDTEVGPADWHDISYVRIWFDEFANTETLLIYKLSATGSRWKNHGIMGRKQPSAPSEAFTLTPVNTKTHKAYRPPYHPEYDEYGQEKTEGGLEFRLENILQHHACVAHRRTDDSEDYRAYDTLTFYLNAHNSDPLISIRIGSDDLNYYEYTTAYSNGIDTINQYHLFKVIMDRFVDLKRGRDSPTDTVSDSTYTVVGNPSLSNNRFLEVRITNQSVIPLTDTIWFNDVKLSSPKSEVGRIVMGNGKLRMADLADVYFSYSESNGRFKRLSESKDMSVKSASRGYSANSSINLDKFLPSSWRFRIPLRLNYSKSIEKPRFSYFSNDLEIEGQESEDQKSRTVMRSYSIGLSKSNSGNWLLKNTLDRLSFNHERTQSHSYKKGLHADTSDARNYHVSYMLDPKFSFELLNQKFYLLPKTINLDAKYNDNSVRSWQREDLNDTTFTEKPGGMRHDKTLTPTLTVVYSPHAVLSANYKISQTRDSVFARKRYGEEVGRVQSFNASLSPGLKIVSPRLTYNSSYNEDYRFENRQAQDLRNVSNTGTYGVDGTINIKGIVKFFTRLRDESKDSLSAVGSPGWVAVQVERFVGHLQNPTFNYSRQRSSSYLNIKVRPEVNYQWGIIDSIPEDDIAAGSYPARGMRDTYGASSGLKFKILSINGGYTGAVNRTYNYGGGENRTDNTSYPNLNLNVFRLEALPFLKKWCRSSSVTSNFNQSFEKRYDAGELFRSSETFNLSPLVRWQSNWVKGISTTLEINYSETVSNDHAGGTTVGSKMTNRGATANFGYTFSAPKGINLPMLKGIKFSSNLSVNVMVNYNQNATFFTPFITPTNKTSSLSSNIGLSYNFSSSVTGGANFDYSQSNDMNSNQDTKRVGLNAWVNINF